MKVCTKCQTEYPEDGFYFDTHAGRYERQCKLCRAAAYRRRYQARIEQERLRSRQYHHTHREQELAAMRQYYAKKKGQRVAVALDTGAGREALTIPVSGKTATKETT